MRSFLLLLGAALLAAAGARAQTPAAPAALDREPLAGRANQKIERIVHEDTGSRIEELRVGGRTERITVQPKGGMPGYEVQTAPQQVRRDDARNGMNSTGERSLWNVMSF